MTHTFTFKGVEATVDYDYDAGRSIQFNNIEDAPEPMSIEINEVIIDQAVMVDGIDITLFLTIDGFRDELENALLKEIDPITFKHL